MEPRHVPAAECPAAAAWTREASVTMHPITEPQPGDHVIVLFGATGDLVKRKLLPGLFHLHAAGLLPRDYRVIGSAPPSFAMTEDQFRAHAREAVAEFGITKPDDPSWEHFEKRLSFGIAEPGNATDLISRIRRAEQEIGGSPRKLFHLAVPPAAFTSVIGMLGDCAGAEPGGARSLRRVASVPHRPLPG
jgi:glucose-6-phosphate 1-dehydrogenase